VHAEDLLTALHVRARHHHLTVEAAGAQQRRVEHVGPVGGGDQDHALVGLEAVHLDEQLVEGLLALVVSAAEAGAAVTADRVDLVHEDDAGRVLLALLEEVAHARARRRRRTSRRSRSPRSRRTARSPRRRWPWPAASCRCRGPDEQDALGDLAAELLELLRVLQELDDLPQLFLGLVDTRHVLERHLVLLLEISRARALPNDSALAPPPCICA
jgi:hypothetical protein